jgi:hypothetical protein
MLVETELDLPSLFVELLRLIKALLEDLARLPEKLVVIETAGLIVVVGEIVGGVGRFELSVLLP